MVCSWNDPANEYNETRSSISREGRGFHLLSLPVCSSLLAKKCHQIASAARIISFLRLSIWAIHPPSSRCVRLASTKIPQFLRCRIHSHSRVAGRITSRWQWRNSVWRNPLFGESILLWSYTLFVDDSRCRNFGISCLVLDKQIVDVHNQRISSIEWFLPCTYCCYLSSWSLFLLPRTIWEADRYFIKTSLMSKLENCRYLTIKFQTSSHFSKFDVWKPNFCRFDT